MTGQGSLSTDKANLRLSLHLHSHKFGIQKNRGLECFGSGPIDPEDDDGGQGDGGHEGMGASVLAGVDAAPIFDAAEHVLDPVVLALKCRVVRYRDLSVRA
jgi:hypothetical protein